MGIIDEKTPVVTTVHSIRIPEEVPQDEFDVPLDIIITPDDIIRKKSKPKTQGILWETMTNMMEAEMPVLKEVKNVRK